jgi:hypothetical protein
MNQLGFDLSEQQPKDLNRYLGKVHFGTITTMCPKAEEDCPTIPGISTRLNWGFEDPSSIPRKRRRKDY